MSLTRKAWVMLAVIAASIGAGVVLLRPETFEVDVTRAALGPLHVTIDEDGVTRLRHHTEIAAPVTGRVAESAVRAGDSVERGAVVARVYPVPLDPRAREAAEAAVRSARSMRLEAAARVQQARVGLTEAQRARARAERLAATGSISRRDLEQAIAEEDTRQQEVEATLAREQAAIQEERRARSTLVDANPSRERGRSPIELRTPMRGSVLRVFVEHDRVVAAGTPLLEVGDPASTEIVIDVLTSDAARIHPGAPILVRLGDAPLVRATVTQVEPAAFTKLSPLGVEEQRVNVIGRFTDPPPRVGDGFKVDASIVIWQSDRTLTVPATALVPVDTGWGVFVVEGSRARLRPVAVGHRGGRAVEILSGLVPGAVVILHPDDRLHNGTRVKQRGGS